MNARVEARRGRDTRSRTLTGPDGSFVLEDVGTEAVDVLAWAPENDRLDPVRTDGVRPGTEDVELRLPALRTVTGRVVDADGRPVVDLEVEGEKEPVRTLVREIQTHPWKATLLHVDFLRIQKGVAVDVEVPLHLVGTPEGVRMGGGSLEQIIHEIPIRCIPSKIPESIEVDVSALGLNEVLHISDIDFDEGIEVRIAQERTICAVALPKAATEAEGDEELEEGEEGVADAPAADAAPAADDSGDGDG